MITQKNTYTVCLDFVKIGDRDDEYVKQIAASIAHINGCVVKSQSCRTEYVTTDGQEFSVKVHAERHQVDLIEKHEKRSKLIQYLLTLSGADRKAVDLFEDVDLDKIREILG